MVIRSLPLSLRLCPAILLFLSLTGLLAADTVSEEPPTIRAIQINFDGFPAVSETLIRSNILVQPDGFASAALIDQSVRALYRTGLFEAIRVEQRTVSPDRLDLVFQVRAKYRISEVVFEGNEGLSNRRLRREIEIKPGDFADEFTAKVAADKLTEFYRKRAFYSARVDYRLERDDSIGRARLVFDIDEGQRVRIRSIDFENIGEIRPRDLRRVMELRQYNRLYSWITGGGKFNRETLIDDQTKLLNFIRDRGYLDAELSEDDVVVLYPRENRVDLRFSFDLGRVYYVGDISFHGNVLYSDERLEREFRLRSGDVFSPSQVAAAVEAIRMHYGSEGYLETRVVARRLPNLQTGAIDLEFRIVESERFRLESINIQGNTKTKSIVILRELALRPAETFDLRRMQNSQLRLENTRFFDSVVLRPESTNIPNAKDLRIVVQEGRTGNLTFGAGFSSIERVVAFAEVTQGNFDLFNPRSFFQGDGQKFRLRLQVGTRSNEIVIAFEEPWVFQRRLALGFEAFRRETRFNSTIFNELRTGFEVYLRKRLFELVEGRLSYGLEQVRIFDVSPRASNLIRAEEGEKLVSKVGLSLVRDTRDRLILTRRGTRLEAQTAVAGGVLGGDVDYWQGQLRAAHFIPTFEFLEQTVGLFGRMGTLVPYSGKDIPFFDRYFLGGPNTLRGFGFRDVGPKDETGEPIGGNSFGYVSVEYGFLLAQPLQLVVFYDWGFLNPEEWEFSTANYNDNWGVGVRIFVLGAPLRLDFGFPITTDEFNDQSMQFNFSFGTRF